jgi:hypothetical protein
VYYTLPGVRVLQSYQKRDVFSNATWELPATFCSLSIFHHSFYTFFRSFRQSKTVKNLRHVFDFLKPICMLLIPPNSKLRRWKEKKKVEEVS